MLTYETWEEDSMSFSERDETKGALAVLEWAYKQYNDEIVYACSFGVEGMVLLHLINEVNPFAQVVFLDTNVHFCETYALIERVRQRFPKLNIIEKQPGLTLEEQEDKYGKDLWEHNPNLCCKLRKILPLEELLANKNAWISGLRREQSETRKHTKFINQDHRFQSIKICPLIHWTWKEVWRYVYKHNLPYNPLHDVGYPSIGCEKCTLPVGKYGSSRDGRWAGSVKTECGLHHQ
ncbi:phosphoadenylyl-sulfate reductase [Bacillus cytotoxicus]|uniref:Adenosine 5'-phosphosulfate reductase n=1 Tax=Bacillus cytotoxicus TaxID=580165 RepID=A0AAX2CEI8_9BACI|nr:MULTISPECIES: phosphoadenylyl-sulfate reductase [Bacillus cereus group]QTR72227.1 phosphoadenylyl-sulfate reductase [Bacillus cytotoxicus]QTR77362.1 phosphoadenylyl-sulfate reductase [Bacillus cytotoxicus]QTR82821.1 phosphoadenylyl-sulfate reductase [Bacillus cytotoxicus]QTR86559.1 phosphoadenylyl-sulfate reductase [Bacillus cytotoxicus]SCL88155.1 Phosphoadenosine phosphosulfate reductase [Bacillus cytotoxicus]